MVADISRCGGRFSGFAPASGLSPSGPKAAARRHAPFSVVQTLKARSRKPPFQKGCSLKKAASGLSIAFPVTLLSNHRES